MVSQPASSLISAKFTALVAPLEFEVFFTRIIPNVLRRIHRDVAPDVLLDLDSVFPLISIVPVLTVGTSIEMTIAISLLVEGHVDRVLVSSQAQPFFRSFHGYDLLVRLISLHFRLDLNLL